jgi:hypothetical protein
MTAGLNLEHAVKNRGSHPFVRDPLHSDVQYKGSSLLALTVDSDNFALQIKVDFHRSSKSLLVQLSASSITYYWIGLLILDHSYLVGNLTNSKIAETKAVEPPKS